MSKGIQRNEAQEIAARYNSRNIPYETAYKKYMLAHGFCMGFKHVAAAFNTFGAEIRKTICSLSSLTEALKNATTEKDG